MDEARCRQVSTLYLNPVGRVWGPRQLLQDEPQSIGSGGLDEGVWGTGVQTAAGKGAHGVWGMEEDGILQVGRSAHDSPPKLVPAPIHESKLCRHALWDVET